VIKCVDNQLLFQHRGHPLSTLILSEVCLGAVKFLITQE